MNCDLCFGGGALADYLLPGGDVSSLTRGNVFTVCTFYANNRREAAALSSCGSPTPFTIREWIASWTSDKMATIEGRRQLY